MFSKLTNALNRGRRRFISREEAVDIPPDDPPTFHSPQVSRVYSGAAQTKAVPSFSKSATIDYAPTALSSAKGQPGGHGSRSYEGASRPSTLARSNTADAAWGHTTYHHGNELSPSRGRRQEAIEGSRSIGSLRGDALRESQGARGKPSMDPYPCTYPGNRAQQERDRLADLADPSKPRLGSYTAAGRRLSGESGRTGYTSPGRRQSAENQSNHDRKQRLGYDPSNSLSQVRHHSDVSKHGIPENTVTDPTRIVTSEHRLRTLKPPESPLVQHAPRKAQTFLGRKTGEVASVATVPHSKSREPLVPPPVPPWKSKPKTDERPSTEKPLRPPQSPVWEKQSAKSMTGSSPLTSPRVLSPLGSPPPHHTKIPGPLSPGGTKKFPKEPEFSPNREERIALYKEQRRKELASLYGKPEVEHGSHLKYSKNLSPESPKEERRVGVERTHAGVTHGPIAVTASPSRAVPSPLIATVAPMATTAITSPITSSSMVTSPLTTSPSKGPLIGMSPVVTSPPPTGKVMTPPKVTSPVTQEELSLKSATKQTLPPSKAATSKVMSPASSKLLSPSHRLVSPDVTATHQEASPTALMSPPLVASPQTARSLFFANMSPTSEAAPKPAPSLIPKMSKPSTQTGPTQNITTGSEMVTKPAELLAAPAKVTSPKSSLQTLAPSEKSAFTPVIPKSPTKLFGKSKSKSSAASASPFTALGALAGPLSALASGGVAMAAPRQSKVAMTTALPTAAVTTVTSSVISPVTTAVTSAPESALSSPESVLLDDLVKSGRLKLAAPSRGQPEAVKPAEKPPEAKALNQHKDSVRPLNVGDTNAKLHIEEKESSGREGRRSLYIEEPLEGALRGEVSHNHPKSPHPITSPVQSLSEPTGGAVPQQAASVTSLKPEHTDVTRTQESKVDLKTKPETVVTQVQTGAQPKQQQSVIDKTLSKVELQKEPVSNASKTEQKERLNRVPVGLIRQEVKPELKTAKTEPVPTQHTQPSRKPRPIDLHIENPVVPTYRYKVVDEAKPREENPEEVITVTVQKGIPDDIKMVFKNVKEPQIMGEVQHGGGDVEPGGLGTAGETELAAELSIPHPTEEEMRVLEAEIREIERRLLGPSPTSPVSHADLYEKAIAQKKKPSEEASLRKEEKKAAEAELAVAMKRMEVKKREAARQMAKQTLPTSPLSPQSVHVIKTHSPVVQEAKILSPVKTEHAQKLSSTPSSVSQTPTTPSTPDRCAIEDEERRQKMILFVREDSFNRADSPVREMIPLPKDSVIARHRQSRSRHRTRKDSSSSSTDSGHSPARSPRASPRSPRSPRKSKAKAAVGSRDSTRLGVDFVPQEVERGRSGRPQKSPQNVIVLPSTESVVQHHSVDTSTTPAWSPPTDQSATSSMGQNATKSSASGQGELQPTESVNQSATPPGGELIEAPSPLVSRHGSDASYTPRKSSSDLSLQLPGSNVGSLAASDSGTSTSSKRERKRFKRRELEAEEEPGAAPEMKVRPGKKDKSSVRKSVLNASIEEEQTDTRRSSAASDEVGDLAEPRRIQNQTQTLPQIQQGVASVKLSDETVTSPEPPFVDTPSSSGHKGALSSSDTDRHDFRSPPPSAHGVVSPVGPLPSGHFKSPPPRSTTVKSPPILLSSLKQQTAPKESGVSITTTSRQVVSPTQKPLDWKPSFTGRVSPEKTVSAKRKSPEKSSPKITATSVVTQGDIKQGQGHGVTSQGQSKPPERQPVGAYRDLVTSQFLPASQGKVATTTPALYNKSPQVVKTTSQVVSQPQPIVNKTLQAVSQPQSVVRTTSQVVSQPQPVIKTTSQVVSQPQPVVKTTSQVVSQPQPVVKTTSQVVSQPQPVVKTTSQVVGQPQPVFQTTSQVASQSQPVVKTTHKALTQPQQVVKTAPKVVTQPKQAVKTTSKIETKSQIVKTTPQVVSQPQPVVKTTPQVVSQPQPVVKTTPQVVSQPQPVVKTTPRVVSQPQPVVKTTPQVVSQPQPVVKTTPQVVSQPQLVAKTTPLVVSQPQPVVKTTTQVVGQPQPVVKTTPLVVGQPQPVVKTTPQVVSQPQPVVKTTPQVVSQPQPVVKTTQRVVSQPQPVVKTTPQVVSQPQPVVKTTPQVVSQPQQVVKTTSQVTKKEPEVAKTTLQIGTSTRQTVLPKSTEVLADTKHQVSAVPEKQVVNTTPQVTAVVSKTTPKVVTTTTAGGVRSTVGLSETFRSEGPVSPTERQVSTSELHVSEASPPVSNVTAPHKIFPPTVTTPTVTTAPTPTSPLTTVALATTTQTTQVAKATIPTGTVTSPKETQIATTTAFKSTPTSTDREALIHQAVSKATEETPRVSKATVPTGIVSAARARDIKSVVIPKAGDFKPKDTDTKSAPVRAKVTEPKTAPVTAKVTEPKTAPVTAKVTEPKTAPVTAKVTEPKTAPVTAKVTELKTAPVTAKVTEPKTAPVTAKVTELKTAPVTAKVTEPKTAPVTAKATEPKTAPVTAKATEPKTSPVTAKATDTQPALVTEKTAEQFSTVKPVSLTPQRHVKVNEEVITLATAVPSRSPSQKVPPVHTSSFEIKPSVVSPGPERIKPSEPVKVGIQTVRETPKVALESKTVIQPGPKETKPTSPGGVIGQSVGSTKLEFGQSYVPGGVIGQSVGSTKLEFGQSYVRPVKVTTNAESPFKVESAVRKISEDQQSTPKGQTSPTEPETAAQVTTPPGVKDTSSRSPQTYTSVPPVRTDLYAVASPSSADGVKGQKVDERSVKTGAKVTPEVKPSGSRRTPERTQSLREETRRSPEKKVPQRAQSFRAVETGQSGAMYRQRVIETPADEQLQKILNRRSRTLEEWEAQLAGSELTAQEIAVREYEQKLEQQKQHKPKEASIMDSEVMSALKARREKEELVDANSNITADSQTDTQPIQRQSSTTTIEVTPLTSMTPVTPKTAPPPATTPVLKKTEVTTETAIKVSSILRPKSQENGFKPEPEHKVTPILKKSDEPHKAVVTSILKKDVADSDVIKPVSILKQTEIQGDPKPVSILRKENIVSQPQTQQTSTFIMVTSSIRKPNDPHVTTIGHPQPAEKPTIQRSETLKESVDEQESQKPVKPILRKAKTVDVSTWDPELTSMLQRQRQKKGLEDEQEERQENGQPVSEEVAKEEVEEEEEEEEEAEDEEEGPKLSIAERIFQMESKIEESKYSKSYGGSGVTTPRVHKLRSAISGPASPGGAGSPRASLKSGSSPTVNLTDERLLAKLTDVAIVRDAADRRREHFQQRKQEEWRTRTQPVTGGEREAADKLDSVSDFRAEIVKKSSLAKFNEPQVKGERSNIQTVKGESNIPQPFFREKLIQRRQNARYKTLPITIQELKDIPEAAPITPTPPTTPDVYQTSISKKKLQRKKVEAARLAAFEDSDSDFDKLVEINKNRLLAQRSPLSLLETAADENAIEDEMSKMSVGQKMALFRKMEEEEKKKSGGGRRFLDRRKRLERSRTQPITEEEIGAAAVIAKEQKAENEAQEEGLGQSMGSMSPRSEVTSSVSMENLSVDSSEVGQGDPDDREESSKEDELSKLSLSEKMKLFSQQGSEKSAPKRDAPVVRRKARRLQSRFKTQSDPKLPVTPEEMEKAAIRISPLALSLVKPPDPEMLQGMSLKDQKEFMAKWATDTLQQIGSRSQPRSSSRPGSDGEEDKEEGKGNLRGILKPEQTIQLEREIRGILRASGAPYPLETTTTSIRADPPGPPLRHPPGILKKDSPPQEQLEARSILKKDTVFEKQRTEPEKSVLKKDRSFETKTEPEKSVLRKDLAETRTKPEENKGILRREVIHVTEVKSVLKSGSEVAEVKDKRGILKSKSFDLDQQTEERQGILRSPDRSKDQEVASPSEVTMRSTGQGHRVESTGSTEDDSSASGGRKIKNDAIARRRHHRELRKQSERYHSQPIEGSTEAGQVTEQTDESRVRAPMTRHHTQPITSVEKEEAETGMDQTPSREAGIANSEVEEFYSCGSESDEQLALLQRSGEENWKRRVRKDGGHQEVKMRVKSGEKKERPTSIADRLSQLQDSQTSWKDRIEETDVKQFTVAGKLELTGKAVTPDSPMLARRRKPKVPLTRDSESSEGSTPTSPTKAGPIKLTPFTTPPKDTPTLDRVKASPAKVNDETLEALSTPNMAVVESSDDETSKPEDDGPTRVDVPQPDNETFTEFFKSKTVEQLSLSKVEVSVDDFDHIFLEAQDILPSTRKAKPQQRRAASSKNPLKTLRQRRDIQSEYIEIRTDVADREMRRIKREQIAGSACFATEALAGLAAKENFAKIMLRKADSVPGGTPGGARFEPYKEVMLMQVKGRRHCQTRLVAPETASINSGDCFILVTTERVWVWIGEFCNVIEKAKAIEVAGVIQQKRDLGCKALMEPFVVEESDMTSSKARKFWEVLGGTGAYQDVGPPEEDEVYEADMADTTTVSRLVGDQFVLWDEASGCVPRYEMLKTKEILLFDFGSELYLWTGKQADFSKRKVALRLAREMWEQGYDYTKFGFNPMCPLKGEEEGGLPLKSATRPDWTLLGKVNQNMETVLFREKFFDWPDSSRLITIKGVEEGESKTDAELTAYDAQKMLPLDTKPVSLVLEGSHVGRGNSWTEMCEGLKREFEIVTLGTAVWHVNEYQVMDLEEVSHGQFHEGDTYVVRWQYMIRQTGMKTLKGADARHSLVGRERCAYFFWQGQNSSINEKGASALMTVELDEERGPQVRVVEGKEPPCFLNLFHSRMVVHLGKRENEDTCTQGAWRLYIVRNELKGEAYLKEVTCTLASLRSRGSFVLVNVRTGQVIVWNGAKSAVNTRQRALEIAQSLKTVRPLEMGVRSDVKYVLSRMDEGSETSDFWRAMGSHDTSAYISLLDDIRTWNHTPRLFQMTSVSGTFEALEVMNPARNPNSSSAFPCLQTDLYTAQQPGLFLVDNESEVYLWQGWWPEGTADTENVSTGSALARFNVDRRCAMETTLSYCQAKNLGRPPTAFLVYAGVEPRQFVNLFPYWELDDNAVTAATKEGRRSGEKVSVREMLDKLTTTRYTWEQLQERPLPEGVDPMCIEAYLMDEEFERVLGMTKEEFAERPSWKQAELKKDYSLF